MLARVCTRMNRTSTCACRTRSNSNECPCMTSNSNVCPQGDDVLWFATDVEGVRYVLKDPRLEAAEGGAARKLRARQIHQQLVQVRARARARGCRAGP